MKTRNEIFDAWVDTRKAVMNGCTIDKIAYDDSMEQFGESLFIVFYKPGYDKPTMQRGLVEILFGETNFFEIMCGHMTYFGQLTKIRIDVGPWEDIDHIKNSADYFKKKCVVEKNKLNFMIKLLEPGPDKN